MRFAFIVVGLVGASWAQEPPPEQPDMPSPSEDFTTDQRQFGEVVTDPERQRDQERRAAAALVKDALPLYTRSPELDLGSEALAGVFAAGIMGLMGGALGEAIDPGDPSQPLGGFHGPVFGALPGSAFGATLGVWGAAQLFGKETDVGWTALGSGIGTIVGGGAAFGIAAGLGEGDSSTTLAVGTFLLAQVGLTMVFTDTFAPPLPTPVDTAESSPRRR